MGSIFKKATGIVTDNGNVYECYNLKENPFPLNPFLNQESTDKRYNGDIYEASVRDIEEMQVEESFLKVPQVTQVILELAIFWILPMLAEVTVNHHSPLI